MLSIQLVKLRDTVSPEVYNWLFDEISALEFQYAVLQGSTHRVCLRAELQGLKRAQMLIAEGNAEYRLRDLIRAREDELNRL